MRSGPVTAAGAVLILGAVLFLWNVWAYDLWAPDEPYFAEGAREMIADGRWAVPHVNGVVTTDKPPLFFWLIALVSLPFGQVTSVTARLPSALAALGTLVLTMRLGRRMYGERAAVMAGLVLATSYLFWDKARSSQIDSLLCFLVLAAISSFEAFRSGETPGRRAGILFWLFASLAVLAKGPVGLVVPLGVALVTLVVDRDLRTWSRFAPVYGPVVLVVVIGSWALGSTFGSSAEYSVWAAFREHVVDRAVHGMHHVQPPWYYLEVIPVKLLPWTGLLPAALLLFWRRRALSSDRFLLVWAFFVVIFFSIPTEKRDLYVLPAFPAFALMLGRLLAPGPDDSASGPWFRFPQAIAGGIVALAGGILAGASGRLEPVAPPVVLGLGAIFLAGGASIAWWALKDRARATVVSSAATGCLVYLYAATIVFPAIDPVKSARAFSVSLAHATATSREAGNEVLSYHLGNLPEAFSFYTRGMYVREIDDPQELARHLESDTAPFAVVNADRLNDLDPVLRERLVEAESAVLSRMRVVLVSARSDER